ncbi:MAG: hypothetical protein ABEH89_01120 [bacterium]
MKRSYVVVLLVPILLSGIAVQSFAARTSLWEIKNIKSWLEGDFEGVGLTSKGTVQPTIATETTNLPARLVWGSVPSNGATIVGTSLPAALYRVNSNNEYTSLKKTDDLGFTAIRKQNGYIYAAATPSGTIYRARSGSDSFVKFSTLPDSYIWTMSPDKDGNGLFVGTGAHGNLYHLAADGTYTKRASLEDPNITSLTYYDGTLHIGTDEGSLFKLSDGKIKSIYGFNNGEVSSLTSDGTYLYVAINQQKKGSQQQQKEKNVSELARQLKQQSLQEQSQQGPIKTGVSKPELGTGTPKASSMMIQEMRKQSRSSSSSFFAGLNGTMVYRIDPPGKMNVIYNDPQEIVHDLESDGENLYVATGGSGRLYKVKRNFTRIAHFKASQKLVLDVRLNDRNQVAAITTGEGGSLHQRRPFDAQKVVYRSKVLDAELMAQWGNLNYIGDGPIELRTRSGNSSTPDEHWSDWTEWSASQNQSINSPHSRYLQFEARFLKPQSQIEEIDIAFLVPNQRPRIANFSVSSNPVRKQFLQSRETSGDNGKNSHSGSRHTANSSSNKVDPSAIKKRTVSWQVIDPDGDPAQTKLFYRPRDSRRWISFTGNQFINDDQYVINLQDLADGKYHIKLTASDRRFNDPGSGFSTSEITGPILVDNTQPEFSDFELSRSKLSFVAKDETSRILIAQYRVNGGNWQTIWPQDKIYDQKTEAFAVQLSNDRKEGDVIELRMIDEGGNQAFKSGTLP